MKTFQEYLTESKKVYNFKIKVAGDIPKDFETRLKEKLDRCKVVTFSKMSTTPVQKVPLDFPNLTNKEVTVYEVVTEYPVTSPEIGRDIKDIGISEEMFRVRGSSEPSELEQISINDTDKKSGPMLMDPNYKETTNVKHKDYFGDDFNKGFLKDLAKTSKERMKEPNKGEYKMPKIKQDKEGAKSAVGS